MPRFCMLLIVSLGLLAAPSRGAEISDRPPAALQPGDRILFQGDSITDGNRGRTADPNHILGHGYVFLLGATLGEAFPELQLDFVNRGISGHTVQDLKNRWQTDAIDLHPDVLSILIGINDFGKGISAEEFTRQYDSLLAETRQALPDVHLVLCEPFALPVGHYKASWPTVLSSLKERQESVARLAEKHGAALVRFQSAFDAACQRAPAEYWIWDGIHPTYQGHQIMAKEWEKTVRAMPAKFSEQSKN